MKKMLYTMYLKKRYYRIIESLIKKVIRFINNSKNNSLKKTIRSAIYYTTQKNRILFSNKNEAKYLLTSCDWISQKLFIDESFDFRVLIRTKKLLGKENSKSTLINVGAHIGSSCIPAIKKNYFKNLIAFEPSKRNFRLLKANILLNEIDDRTQIYNLALSNKKANLYLGMFNNNTGDYRIVKNKQKNTEIIQSDILDNYTYNLNKNNSLVFMDAQGHEAEIFMGAKKTIRKKIPFVFEFAPFWLNKDWLKKISILFKYYNFFHDLKTNKKKRFNAMEIKKLYDHYLINNNATDILIK